MSNESRKLIDLLDLARAFSNSQVTLKYSAGHGVIKIIPPVGSFHTQPSVMFFRTHPLGIGMETYWPDPKYAADRREIIRAMRNAGTTEPDILDILNLTQAILEDDLEALAAMGPTAEF